MVATIVPFGPSTKTNPSERPLMNQLFEYSLKNAVIRFERPILSIALLADRQCEIRFVRGLLYNFSLVNRNKEWTISPFSSHRHIETNRNRTCSNMCNANARDIVRCAIHISFCLACVIEAYREFYSMPLLMR